MDKKLLLDEYLPQQHMMQLATYSNSQPWCCTVYYVHDVNHNLYWASRPSQRHSQEIATQPNVAAAIAIRFTKGEKVVGIQLEGTAELQEPSESIREITKQYAEKFGRDKVWIEDFVSGKTEHRLYKLTPSAIQLFDEVNFPIQPKQKVI